MSDDPNVFETESWEREMGAARGSRLGPRAGSSALGCALYELDPGGQATPYHMHHANEELLIVPEVAEQIDTGTILAMTSPGDGWAFPAGAEADYMALTLAAIKADQ